MYAITQYRIIDYADDTNVHCSNKNVHAVEDDLNSDLENPTTWFFQNGMKPNLEKYQAMVLGTTEDKLLFKSGNIDIRTTKKTNLLGVVLNSKLKFDDHVSSICCKVSIQISALNKQKNILLLKTKEPLYCSFILPNFYYCNHVWHHCGKTNTTKIKKVNERALRYVYNDKHTSYQHHLERIRVPSMESRRILDMLLTIHKTMSNKAPRAIRNLIDLCSFKYNLRHQEYALSLPKVNTPKYRLGSWRYFAVKKWNKLSNFY